VDKEEYFWDKVIWSDETQIKLFHSKRVQTVWRKKNSADKHIYIVPTIKHGGGSITIWGCMASNGIETINFIDGILDKMAYLNSLKSSMKQSAQKLRMPPGYIFQQHNDAKHTAQINMYWLI